MSLPRTYRDWSIDINDLAPASMQWQAVHKDYDASYEGPEDGWVGSHPVLSAATEKDLMVEIDCWEMDREECMRTFEVCFGNPRKSMQSVYEVRAETAAEATAEGKRMAKADRIPQAYWNTVEARA